MESGLEDRNNAEIRDIRISGIPRVSMESGLEDRNNALHGPLHSLGVPSQWSPA